MKIATMVIMIAFLALVIIGCAETAQPVSQPSLEPTRVLTEDEKILQQHPDDLDNALEELEQVE